MLSWTCLFPTRREIVVVFSEEEECWRKRDNKRKTMGHVFVVCVYAPLGEQASAPRRALLQPASVKSAGRDGRPNALLSPARLSCELA